MQRLSAFHIGLVALVLVAAGAFAIEPSWAVDPATAVTIVENNRTQTVDAHGGTVTIGGNGNHVTITGECRELTIQGNKNEVTVEAVAVVSVPGNKNRVTWSRALGSDKPQVSNLGSDNEVSEGSR